MIKRIAFILICLTFSTTSFSQSEEYRREIFKMFELSGTKDVYKTYLDQMLPMIKDIFKDQGEDVWKEFKKEITSIAMDELYDELVPIYYKHLELEDIKEINAFYKTKAGKRLVAQLPEITKESMEVGQVWGQRLSLKVEENLRKKGLID